MFSNDEAGIGNEDAWLMKKKKRLGVGGGVCVHP